ncbi:hypothetical protein V6N12_042681, partial [Hibiscus sabdariffa]
MEKPTGNSEDESKSCALALVTTSGDDNARSPLTGSEFVFEEIRDRNGAPELPEKVAAKFSVGRAGERECGAH